ncbi:TKL/DICTY4 protein kinase [Salpingoeca rosetta]|uniref:guanylate cyclase n=1 Tax=Salpingoeca rosetta (strain ATCC 50818 / BSB-021) TaxID=946362 RepID=F2UN31_SALR5|nr:TKL/DICTY4 protein kinase [Salpingoeca rosetta]EGD78530.1 TKL/DICTY4 protein kinase [Salpingoeca rosetta]|eukprot:XP_004989479.1 TKL/DICTY4 protein kinase [Salpingoeca rosetta]
MLHFLMIVLATALTAASPVTAQQNGTAVPAAYRIQIGCVLSPLHPEACDAYENFLNAVIPGLFAFHRMSELELLDQVDTLEYALVDTKTMSCLDVEQGFAPLNGFGLPVVTVSRRQPLEKLLNRTNSLISRKIQFLGTHERVLDAVLSGDAAAGMVQTGFLEQAAHDGLLNWEDIDILAQEIAITEDGTRFPYFSSTLIYPGWTVVATSFSSLQARTDVLNFVLAVPSTTIAFTSPESFAGVGDILENFGVIERDLVRTTETRCVRKASHVVVPETNEGAAPAVAMDDGEAQAEQIDEPGAVVLAASGGDAGSNAHTSELVTSQVICPNTHFIFNHVVLATRCAGRSCPDQARCLCRPCQKSPPVLAHVSPVQVTEQFFQQDTAVAARDVLLTSCERMRVCAFSQQAQTLHFVLEDQLYFERPNKDTLFYFVSLFWAEADGTTSTEAVPLPTYPNLAAFNITGTRYGTGVVEIYVADRNTEITEWQPIDGSPFLLQVSPRDCPDGMEPTQDNTCECPVGTLEVNGGCMQAKEYLPIFIGSALAVIGIGVYIAIAVVRRNADKLWQIDAADVVVSDPPEVLGMGAFGVVIKGELNGTGIAIKRVMPRSSKKTTDTNGRSTRTRGRIASSKRSAKSASTVDSSNVDVYSMNATSTIQASKTTNGFGMKFGNVDNEAAIERALEWQDAEANKATTARTGHGKEISNAKSEFMAEIRLLSRLRHPCVATMLGAIVTKSSEVLLVMEYLEHGSLYDFLRNDKLPTPDMFLLPIVKDIVSGMRYIHNLKPPVVHGDLKAKNVLVDGNFKAKISDFGLSQKQRFGCGTPMWMAPEVLRGGEVTREADVYSFAITVYEIYSRQDPFPEEDASEVLRQIAARQVPAKRPDIPDSCPVMLAELARRCWSEEPKFRPTFDQVDAQLGELNISKVGASLIQQKQDALNKATVLNDVFPEHIAKMLEEGKKVHPEHKDDVTIFSPTFATDPHVDVCGGPRAEPAPWVKLESRGVQNIKGKGEMLTYWLVSTRKPEQTGRVAIAENEATVIDMGEGDDASSCGIDDGDCHDQEHTGDDADGHKNSAQPRDSIGGGFVFKKKCASSIGRQSAGTHESRASARVSLSSVSWLNDAKEFEALSRDSFGSRRTSTTPRNPPPPPPSSSSPLSAMPPSPCDDHDDHDGDASRPKKKRSSYYALAAVDAEASPNNRRYSAIMEGSDDDEVDEGTGTRGDGNSVTISIQESESVDV